MKLGKPDVEEFSDIRYSLWIKDKVLLREKEEDTYRFDTLTGKITASAMFRVEMPGIRKNIMSLVSSEGKEAIVIDAEGMSVFAYAGKKRVKVCAYQPHTWFCVCVSLDTRRHAYQLFIDGVKYLEDAYFYEEAEDIASYRYASGLGVLEEMLVMVYRNPIQSVSEAAAGKRIYDAGSMGVEADGVTDVTGKLQGLIDRCAAKGGGVVYLRGGVYRSGMLVLKSGTELYLETDATLKGSLDIRRYCPLNHPNWNMAHYGPQMALIYGENLDGPIIEGGGTIDGSGAFAGDYGSESTRPSAILLVGCHHVRIRDVYIKDSGMWTMPMVNCDDLYLRDIRLFSCWFPNRDGIDFCDSHDVLLENCSFISDDDTVCFKSGDERGCDNILVRHMMLTSVMANAVKFGTGSYGKFTDCVVRDCVIKDTRLGAICVESVDGARIAGLTFAHIEIQTAGAAFFVVLGDRGSIPPSGQRRVGSIDGIRFHDIAVSQITQPYGCYISGLEKDGRVYRIGHITFDGVRASYPGGVHTRPSMPPEYGTQYPEVDMFRELPAACYFIRHADKVTFRNCRTEVVREDARDRTVAVDATLDYPSGTE